MNRRRFLQASTSAIMATYLPVSRSADAPVSPFGASSTAEDVTSGLDLTGKTALVTGCNSGIGYETMRVLALRGAHVIGTGRTFERARDACDSVEGSATPAVLELSDFDSVVACAESVQAMVTPGRHGGHVQLATPGRDKGDQHYAQPARRHGLGTQHARQEHSPGCGYHLLRGHLPGTRRGQRTVLRRLQCRFARRVHGGPGHGTAVVGGVG